MCPCIRQRLRVMEVFAVHTDIDGQLLAGDSYDRVCFHLPAVCSATIVYIGKIEYLFQSEFQSDADAECGLLTVFRAFQ